MPIVGNDIVDLKDQANTQKSMDLRYLRKILTDAEIEQVRNRPDSDSVLWSFWTCKEAAFKVINKIDGDAAFVPRRWSVFLRTHSTNDQGQRSDITACRTCRRSEGVVQIAESCEIPFYLFASPSYIHCIAADEEKALGHSDWSVNELTGIANDPSEFGRLCLARRLEAIFQDRPGTVEIHRRKKNEALQPPVVYRNGLRADVDVSLSHDGRFAAYAFVLL